MSEYMDKHNVSRLVGAPPGYVGYEEGGQLTELIRRRPYQIVLFDEFEKAHRDVSNVLLQVLDEGFLTDGQGRKVDFRNTIVVMTSNIGSEIIARSGRASTEHVKEQVLSVLGQHLSPEFMNRIDDIITFNQLSPQAHARGCERSARAVSANVEASKPISRGDAGGSGAAR
mmetsp:Transcript_53723/g.116852  ORF Transcript_53723/g.116852 Transcript_53723/m.116852 type:complete len:171 (+) Transcript_53723:917-1429(+)